MQETEAVILRSPGPIPVPIPLWGRPKGLGCNVSMLGKLIPGDVNSCLFGVTPKKANSIRVSAQNAKIKLRMRKLEDGTFAIWRLKHEPKNSTNEVSFPQAG